MGKRLDKTPMTVAEAREIFAYKPRLGVLIWVKPKGRVAPGSECGSQRGNGYLQLEFRGRNYLVHRIIWAIKTGAWPVNTIDHKDGNRANNKWRNLRDVTHQVNTTNQRKARVDNQSGLLGVSTLGRGGFKAAIQTKGKNQFIGKFKTPELAHAAYLKAKRKLHEGNTL